MKRFDDILKIVLGILIGQTIKEQDDISGHLVEYFHHYNLGSYSVILAKLAPWLMVTVYLRNIHGAVRYDEATSDGAGLFPAYERHPVGRAGTFIFALLALFVLPYWAEHKLAGKDLLIKSDVVVVSPIQLVLLVLGPVLVYFVWNLALWLFSAESVYGDRRWQLENVLISWLRIDAISMLMALGLLLDFYRCAVKGAAPNGDMIVVVLMVILFLSVFLDYLFNLRFYFPDNTLKPED